MTERIKIGKQLLVTVLESVKDRALIEGFAYDWLEEIIEISYLNDFKELMKEALKLRNSKEKLGNPLSGAITNIKLNSVGALFTPPKNKAEIEKKYSYKKVEDFVKICENSRESYLYIKSSGEVEEAIKRAKDDFELELIACSLIMNGEFEEAQNIIKNELSEFEDRIHVVKTALCIEYFRKDEIDKAKIILQEISPNKDDCWGNLFLAKGILGYEPWGGYPNSDY